MDKRAAVLLKKGFTILEILVVVGLLTLVALATLLILSGTRGKSRNVKRVVDLNQIAVAIELYRLENGDIPPGDDGAEYINGDPNWIPGLTPLYIGVVPSDPLDNSPYQYHYMRQGVNYEVAAFMEQHGRDPACKDGGPSGCGYYEKGPEFLTIYNPGASGWNFASIPPSPAPPKEGGGSGGGAIGIGTSTCPYLWDWTLTSSTKKESGISVAEDRENNIIAGANISNFVLYNPSRSPEESYVYLAKFSPAGELIWSKHIDGTSIDNINAVAVDAAGDVFVTGTFNGNIDFGGGSFDTGSNAQWIYLVKYSGIDGRHIWSKSFGNIGSNIAYALAIDAAGDAYIGGGFSNTIDFGGGPMSAVIGGVYDIFVAKFNGQSGSHIWSKRFGGSRDESVWGLAIDRDGRVAATGYLQSPVDYGGGNLVITPNSGGAVLLLVLDGITGNHIMSKSFGGMSTTRGDAGTSVAVDFSNNIVLTGRFAGDINFGGDTFTPLGYDDIFIARLRPDGTHVWSKQFGSADYDQSLSLALDSSGSPVITGRFRGILDFGGGVLTSAGGFDGFVAKFSGIHGRHICSRRFGSASADDLGRAVTVNADNQAAVVGNFSGNVDFGGGPVNGLTADMFILKLDK